MLIYCVKSHFSWKKKVYLYHENFMYFLLKTAKMHTIAKIKLNKIKALFILQKMNDMKIIF